MIIKPAQFNGIVTIEGTPALDIKRVSTANGISSGYVIGEGENAIYISSTSGSINTLITALIVFCKSIIASGDPTLATIAETLSTALSQIVVEG